MITGAFIVLTLIAPNPDSLVIARDAQVTTIIENLSGCKEKTTTEQDGSSATSYRLNGKLCHVIWRVQDEDVQKRVSWSFKDGEVIFCHQYWVRLKPDATATSVVSDERFYIQEGRLIVWISNDNSRIDPSAVKFQRMNEALPKLVRSFNEEK